MDMSVSIKDEVTSYMVRENKKKREKKEKKMNRNKENAQSFFDGSIRRRWERDG